MNKKQGTPNSLTKAIANGLDDLDIHSNSKITAQMRLYIKDYMAQKFGVAMLSSELDDAQMVLLKKLFEEITKE